MDDAGPLDWKLTLYPPPPLFCVRLSLLSFLACQSALSLDIMCNSVYTDVMQTIGVADPTLPQQPIPMQVGDAATLARLPLARERALGRI